MAGRIDRVLKSRFHIVLFRPEIPYNTGNIIRLCANVGAELHLIRPLGFEMDEAHLRRAALDYTDLAIVTEYDSLEEYLVKYSDRRLFAISARAAHYYTEVQYKSTDSFIFGPESVGLPDSILQMFPNEQKLVIPMMPDNRSLNVANAVSIVAYEAWRQLGFAGKSLLRDL